MTQSQPSQNEWPAIQLNAFANLIEAWFGMHGLRASDYLSDDEFSDLEQAIGEELFDLIQAEVGDRVPA